jgi:formylglycine-generating enzyme required for sulfatase activity
VREGACEDTSVLGCEEGHCQGLKTGYWRDPANALLPVAYLTYEGATDYCSFLGGRLPTNAEWEKAARGENGRRWPWAETLGDDPFNIDREERAAIDAMWNDGDVPAHRPPGAEGGDLLIAIDSFPEGRGPYGHYGLMGNAWEWIFDRMELYGTDRLTDPTGPATADIPGLRILRPGPDYIWDRLLERDDPAEHVDRLGSRLWPQGTRCAFDVEPDALPMWE